MAFISKEEKQAYRFKAEKDRLSLFCADPVGFLIRTAYIYKAANLPHLKGKDEYHLPVLAVQEGLDNENSFSRLAPSMLCSSIKKVICL